MLRFSCEPFFELTVRIVELRTILVGQRGFANTMQRLELPARAAISFSDEDLVKVRNSAQAVLAPCRDLKMRMTARSAERLIETLDHWRETKREPSPEGGEWILVAQTEDRSIMHCMSELLSRIEDELASKLFIEVEPSVSHLYEGSDDFTNDATVCSKFPRAVEDIQEAVKCLALERFTASVFHLMRAMEICVQVLSTKIGIQNPAREWGKLLSDMDRVIQAMPKGDERNRWSESHTHLYHVKQAWRNDVMHPKQTYSEEEAHAVFMAVKSFMRHLASLA